MAMGGVLCLAQRHFAHESHHFHKEFILTHDGFITWAKTIQSFHTYDVSAGQEYTIDTWAEIRKESGFKITDALNEELSKMVCEHGVYMRAVVEAQHSTGRASHQTRGSFTCFYIFTSEKCKAHRPSELKEIKARDQMCGEVLKIVSKKEQVSGAVLYFHNDDLWQKFLHSTPADVLDTEPLLIVIKHRLSKCSIDALVSATMVPLSRQGKLTEC